MGRNKREGALLIALSDAASVHQAVSVDNGEVVRETVYAGDSDAFDYWILATRGTFARCAAFPSFKPSFSCSRVSWAKTSTKTS